MVRIMTDSAADFSRGEADGRGFDLLPLSIIFDDRVYNQEDDPGFRLFYELLAQHRQIPSTSQATPESYLAMFERALQAGDELVAITLSSGLSSTYQSALLAREMLGYERVYVVDSQNAILGQRILVEHALALRDQGKSGREIFEALTGIRARVRVFGMLDTLEYLRKGGRVPKSAALLGTLLSVKPIIIVKDGVLGMEGKARGSQAGIKMMLERIGAGTAIDRDYPVYFGHANAERQCQKFKQEACAKYDLADVPMVPIGGIVGTHVGPGTVAIGYVEKA